MERSSDLVAWARASQKSPQGRTLIHLWHVLLSSIPGASVNVQNPWLQAIPAGNRAMQCVSFLSVETHNPTQQTESHFHASGFSFVGKSAVFNGVEITLMIYLFDMSLIACVLGSGPLTLRSKTNTVKFRAIGFLFTA